MRVPYKRALITGATGGIGEALARALPAETGLLLTGRDEQRLATLRTALASGARIVETIVADLSSDAGRSELIAVAEGFGVDLLINNAGLGYAGSILENGPDREREMVAVNVTAPVVLTAALLPGMIDRVERARASGDAGRRAGVMIFASVASFMPLPRLATYAATKAFDLHYAEGLAVELRNRPVDVLVLCPGPVATQFAERAGLSFDRLLRPMSADRVAREGLRALGRKTVHVVGARNRLAGFIPRLTPRGLISRVAGAAMRRADGRSPSGNAP